MNILLLGQNGQLGWALQRSLALLGTLQCPDMPGQPRVADLAQPEALADWVRGQRPDVIVNAAAYTAVDQAETEPGLAHAVNAEAPAALARVAHQTGAWLVHYSTDYVFDGAGDHLHQEDEPAAPLSVYGRSKREGEQAIIESGCRHLILRTSWVYGTRGGNFARTMLRLAQEREVLRVIHDQIGAPTPADLLADITAQALPQLLAHPQRGGLYHAVAAGETSWHGYARHVIEQARQLRPDLPWKVRDIEAIPSSAYPVAARRPLNSRLDTRKLCQTFGLQMPHWQAGVDRWLQETLAPRP